MCMFNMSNDKVLFSLSVYSAVLGKSLESKKLMGRPKNVMTQVGVMINAIITETLSGQ